MAPEWPNNVYLLMVVRDSHKAVANLATYVMYPGIPEGADNFEGALIEATTPPQYSETPTYWACGAQVMPTQRDDLLQAILVQGFRAREATVITPDVLPDLGDDLWVFDGGSERNDPGYWSYATILDTLALRVAMGEPT